MLYVQDRNTVAHTTAMLFGGFLALYPISSGTLLKAKGHSSLVMSQIFSVIVRARKDSNLHGSKR